MIIRINYWLAGIVLTFLATTLAQGASGGGGGSNKPSNPPNNDVSNIATYLQNLGQYFGYDLTQYCTTGGPCSTNSGGSNNGTTPAGGGTQAFSNTLVDQTIAYAAELNLYNTFLGSLIGGITATQTPNPIVPTTLSTNNNLSGYSIINTLAGQTFANPPYSNASNQTVSVSPIIDQQTFQSDPVSQAILNMLATPNYTFCLDSSTNLIAENCPYLYRENIIKNVIGSLPGTQKVFSAETNIPLIPQLNINTLISPLLYSTTSTNTSGTTSSSSFGNANNNSSQAGLTANTQAQQAENFIRYATGAVIPISLPDWNTYDNLISQALNFSKQTPLAQQQQAYAQLTTYLAKLRSYAAQTSVGVSNLYYIMSRRLPQTNTGQGQGSQTSQALNEYIMASWRLYNPQAQGTSSNPGQQQWLTQINQASNASVQKEIAILLAEMNYQLYLMRQQQERILLTNSMLLLESSTQIQPDGSTLTTIAPTNTNTSANTSS